LYKNPVFGLCFVPRTGLNALFIPKARFSPSVYTEPIGFAVFLYRTLFSLYNGPKTSCEILSRMSNQTRAYLRGVTTANEALSNRLGKSGWVRFADLPIGQTFARKLIAGGFLESIVIASPGSKRGVRLISIESFNRYVREYGKAKIERGDADAE
jgi:hypothetical protein